MKAASAEFKLTVECCRWAFTGGDPAAVHGLCATVDWDRFTRTVRFHRVQGLVWNSLWSTKAEVPSEIARALASNAEAIAATNLQIAVESRELCANFETAGIALMFVKGLTVGALAYPRPLLKMGWDIDLLIDREQLAGAAEILSARGYRLAVPAVPAELHSWHRRSKESVWDRGPALHVELHTRLADHHELIPRIDVHSPRREVEVAAGIALPTLAADELFAYLCVHGASSAWFRLKWITDLAAILHPFEPAEIERLYRRSQGLGAGRAAAQALLLADELYGSLRGTQLKQRLRRDRAGNWLAAMALRQLAGRAEPREPTEVRFGTARIHLSQLLLLPGARFALTETVRQVRAAVA